VPGVSVSVDAGDTTPPTISDVQVASVSDSTMTITWETNEPTPTRVDYGTTSPSATAATPSLSTDHSITVTNLKPSTNYVFQVVAADLFGNTTVDDGYSQSTAAGQATETPEQTPFITNWLSNGFYAYPTVSLRMATDFLGGDTTVSPAAGMVSGKYQWVSATAGSNGYTDLAAVYGSPTQGVGYVSTYIYSPVAQSAELWMGTDDGLKVYLNGVTVWTNDVYRSWLVDQDKAPVSLSAGWNCLLVKVTQGGGGWGISARCCDHNGNQLPGVYYDAGP
jgi:hypothetical protein